MHFSPGLLFCCFLFENHVVFGNAKKIVQGGHHGPHALPKWSQEISFHFCCFALFRENAAAAAKTRWKLLGLVKLLNYFWKQQQQPMMTRSSHAWQQHLEWKLFCNHFGTSWIHYWCNPNFYIFVNKQLTCKQTADFCKQPADFCKQPADFCKQTAEFCKQTADFFVNKQLKM